ncbi:MAG TPA: FtsH protease activity modulator HflK [Thermoanaerobaculia bacterium]|nr:FtsH protease activity modulator HflK [Thermoanaerobaculia bacterium]
MKRFALVFAAAAGAAVLLASIVVVGPQERAVVFRFGSPLKRTLGPGLGTRIPLVDRVVRVEVTRTFTVSAGSADAGSGARAASFLTGDTNLLVAECALQYRIADPVRFLVGAADVSKTLKREGEGALTEELGASPVDDVLSVGRTALLERVRSRVQREADGRGLGVVVISAAWRSLDPAPPVIDAFQAVQNAAADRERLQNDARAYSDELASKARGEAQALIEGTEAARVQRVEAARGDANRFAALAREAGADPALLRSRLWLETAGRLVPKFTTYVIDGRGGGTKLRLVKESAAK